MFQEKFKVDFVPSRYTHRKISKILTGKSCESTHNLIDYPVRFLGKKHRILFHDPISALAIGFLSDGLKGSISALAHLALDEAYSKNKLLRQLIDYLL
jgi:hypothetical protein